MRRLQNNGKDIPLLDNRPVVLPGCEWLWDAFFALSTRRKITEVGVEPISISEISAYATLMRISDDTDRELLLEVCTRLDPIVMKHVVKKRGRRPSETMPSVPRRNK